MRDLTADWLSGVLRSAGAIGATPVTSLDVERIGDFSSQLWRLHLGYGGAGTEGPASVILKRPKPGREAWSRAAFVSELAFYRDVAPHCGLAVPRFYYGAVEPANDRTMLLLEDVAGLQHFSWNASPAHARRAVEGLAKLHARFLEPPRRLPAFPSLSDASTLERYGAAFDASWSKSRDFFASLAGGGFTEIGDRLVGRVPRSLAPLGARTTLLHGDAHGENIPMTAAGSVVFLDWASACSGAPSFDLGVFLPMSFDPENRRDRERALVALHSECLRREGATPLDDPWLSYRLAVLRRAALMVENVESLHPSLAVDGNPPANFVIERCITAAVDLDVGALTG